MEHLLGDTLISFFSEIVPASLLSGRNDDAIAFIKEACKFLQINNACLTVCK